MIAHAATLGGVISETRRPQRAASAKHPALTKTNLRQRGVMVGEHFGRCPHDIGAREASIETDADDDAWNHPAPLGDQVDDTAGGPTDARRRLDRNPCRVRGDQRGKRPRGGAQQPLDGDREGLAGQYGRVATQGAMKRPDGAHAGEGR